jgi:hypothetical protein
VSGFGALSREPAAPPPTLVRASPAAFAAAASTVQKGVSVTKGALLLLDAVGQAQKEYPQMGELARHLESLRWSADGAHAAAQTMLGSAQRLSIYSRHVRDPTLVRICCGKASLASWHKYFLTKAYLLHWATAAGA